MSFFNLTKNDLKEYFIREGLSAFRGRQLLEWVYHKGVTDVSAMTNLGVSLRKKIASDFSFSTLERVRCVDSGDGETYKFLWRLFDGKLVESVLICSGGRRTVCVSSQVGCSARCSFCASGKNGLFRNLSTAEIVEQIWNINAWLRERGERVCHVVYMGMGEPMENYDSLVKSIEILKAPDMFGISPRRITVSTVGVVKGIRKLAETGLNVNLAFSLHAPNQEIREKIIRYAKRYPLKEIMDAVDDYALITKRDITYEYTLIAGVNDREEHAHELVTLLGRRQCSVNLIPYNPIDVVNFKRPGRRSVEIFRDILRQHGVNHTCRYTKGDDISAACGQLAIKL